MVSHEVGLFATVVALLPFVTLLVKLIHILLKWNYKQDKNHAT